MAAGPHPATMYAKARRAVREAYALLDTTCEELYYYIQERSQPWQDSDRAADLEADRDELDLVLQRLDKLSICRFKPHRRRQQ
jgi:hypothetical protein